MTEKTDGALAATLGEVSAAGVGQRAAFELDGEGRSRFPDQECGSDRALRSAVEALLAQPVGH